MIDALLRDAAQHPKLFSWRGRIPLSQIGKWEQEQTISIPPDLKALWSTMGGGDLFESESILQPFGTEDYDLILPLSEINWQRGLDKGNYVFHTGLCISCFRKSDGLFVTLNQTDLSYMAKFEDLDSWYMATLRAEYQERYQLS